MQEKQRELEMHMRADSLEKALEQRPVRGTLVKEGILAEGEGVAPGEEEAVVDR